MEIQIQKSYLQTDRTGPEKLTTRRDQSEMYIHMYLHYTHESENH